MGYERCPSCGRFARWDGPRGWWVCDYDERMLPKPPASIFEPGGVPLGRLLMRQPALQAGDDYTPFDAEHSKASR